jgi:hypothetical protein
MDGTEQAVHGVPSFPASVLKRENKKERIQKHLTGTLLQP